jgi:hypothetical protein
MYVYGVDGTNTINSILVPRFKNQITRVDFLCVCVCAHAMYGITMTG